MGRLPAFGMADLPMLCTAFERVPAFRESFMHLHIRRGIKEPSWRSGSQNYWRCNSGSGLVPSLILKESKAKADELLKLFQIERKRLDMTEDATGDVYIADTGHNAIKEPPSAFVDPTSKLECVAAGRDSLPMVLPATENLLPPFAPTSDQSWLTIGGITNDVVNFAFAYNPANNRSAHINLLGQRISVIQTGAGVTPPTLIGSSILSNGAFHFSFANTTRGCYKLLSK
jgi:hypothetical protein